MVLYDMPECGGCRTCELACGYRHTSVFTHASSSIRIVDRPDRRGHTVALLDTAEDARQACDGCPGLDEPFCVVYCREADALAELLSRFLEQARPETKRSGN